MSGNVDPEVYPRHLTDLFSDNVYLSDPWHDDIFLNQPDDDVAKSTWRLKDRMKTAGVALVLCLNLGTDPPDVVKPHPCARRECWFDPSGPKLKGLELIGNALQQQYERWQSKAKYKQCLDPTSEDLRRLCINLRKSTRNDRLLFHYNGHGVPRPTKNGELWVFGKHYTHYMPVAVVELRSWLGDPAIYVLDCSGAGALLPHFMDLSGIPSKEKEKEKESLKGSTSSSSFTQFMSPIATGKGSSANLVNTGAARQVPFGGAGFGAGAEYANFIQRGQTPSNSQQVGVDSQTIVLAACRSNEILPLNPQYPADLFTSCLTTPIPIALRWFILQNPHSMGDISVDLSENIPGDSSDRKTPRGELHWIFTAVTDTIAWNTLPSNVFQKLFREDLLAASLFRNFLLAKRLMKSLNCTPQSWPPLPDSSTHPLWQTWDQAAESCLFHISSLQRSSSLLLSL
jgi:regulator-associated protein of mTOR